MPMPFAKIVKLFRLVGKLFWHVRVAIRRGPQPICAECAFAHMQFATSGEQRVFCTFGGGVRPVEINVMFCTDFSDRSLPTRSNAIVGFVSPLPGIETACAEAARHGK